MNRTSGPRIGDVVHRVTDPSDVVWCRLRVMQAAGDLGFDTQEQWCIAIATSELASNAVKYAGSGTVTVRAINEPTQGIEVEIVDHGPGIADIGEALRDREGQPPFEISAVRDTSPRGLGQGLGAVRRLVDVFELTSVVGQGTHAIIRKWRGSHKNV